MDELFPLASGLLVGLLLGTLTARHRALVWIIASAVLGAAATFLSGEWRMSWGFLLVDIPLVAGSAVLAYMTSRRLTPALAPCNLTP